MKARTPRNLVQDTSGGRASRHLRRGQVRWSRSSFELRQGRGGPEAKDEDVFTRQGGTGSTVPACSYETPVSGQALKAAMPSRLSLAFH